jgi:hypothetical protein
VGLVEFVTAASSAGSDQNNAGAIAAVGALAAIVGGLAGGLGGSWLIGWQENLRARAAHRRAVRAVGLEMLANWSLLDGMTRQKKKDFSLSDRIYVNEIQPLLDGLPAEIAAIVGVAYSFAHSLHETPDPRLVPLALQVTIRARDALLRYGENALGLPIKPLQDAMAEATALWEKLDGSASHQKP